MPIIFLIRHGESQSNIGMPTLYPSVVELTEKGWEQAKEITRFLQKIHFYPELIVTSSYLRTKQTAAPTTLAYTSVPEEQWPVHEFTYLSSWHIANSTVEERQPAVEAYWEFSDPSYIDGRSSESFEQFIARVRAVKLQIANSKLKSIVMFSHEQFISAFLWLSKWNRQDLTPDAMKDFRAFLKAKPVPNAAIVCAQLHNDQEHMQWELIMSHLDKPAPVPLGRN